MLNKVKNHGPQVSNGETNTLCFTNRVRRLRIRNKIAKLSRRRNR